MFGDAEKVKFTPTTAQQRFVALQSGEVDVITRNATQTLMRDTALGFNFAGVNFYDGQGFMVPTKKHGVKSAKELNGATICVQPGTTTELNLADYFRKQQDDLQAGGDREARRAAAGLLRRPLRCPTRPTPRAWPPCAPASSPATGRHIDPAGAHLQGAAGPDRAPRRRPVVRPRALDAVRA